ncbi:MAG: AAA family ATPase [Cetobacterium sp.]
MARIQDIKSFSSIDEKNIILVGENSTAKTYLLEIWVNQDVMNSWYMGTNNRNIILDDSVEETSELKFLHHKNIETRCNSEIIDDPFESTLGTKNGAIFFGYMLKKYFIFPLEKYFNESLSVMKNRLSIGSIKHDKISDGLQAIIRIISEIEFAKASGIKNIFIDEIEKGLDHLNSFRLMKFIEQEYQDMNFIITTHSAEVLMASSKFKIIKILNTDSEVDKKDICFYDSKDYTNIKKINEDFFYIEETNIFEKDEQFVSNCLEIIMNDNTLEYEKIEKLNIIFKNPRTPISLCRKAKSILDYIERVYKYE